MDGPDPDRDRPPADPEDWSDEEWILWLRATDDEDQPEASPGSAPVTAMGRLIHSPEGQALGQAMLGLSYAMFGRRDDEIVIVAEGSGDPADEGPVSVELDSAHPERSRAVVRRPTADGVVSGPDDHRP